MMIMDSYLPYPLPTSLLPFNYCALPRLAPWTKSLLAPLCP